MPKVPVVEPLTLKSGIAAPRSPVNNCGKLTGGDTSLPAPTPSEHAAAVLNLVDDGVIEWNDPEVVRALRGALKYGLRTPNRQQRNGSPLKPHEIAPSARLTRSERMQITRNGSIASTLAASLSFEKRYTLNVIVTDFTGDFDLLIVPVLAWLRENQPDIMTTDEGQKKGFTFYADINNDSSFDISISLMLTERTLVSEVDGALHVKNIPEPPPPEPVTRPMELYINGELVSKWDE
ncbi:phage tail protein [Escherichia coli]|nr:phage tail protein [Escherichia coli]